MKKIKRSSKKDQNPRKKMKNMKKTCEIKKPKKKPIGSNQNKMKRLKEEHKEEEYESYE